MWVTWQKNQEWDGIMSNRHTETRAHHGARTSWTRPGGGPRTGAQTPTVVWRLRGCKEGRRRGRKKGIELSQLTFTSKESLFISLQNCQKCQNNKETLFAGRTLFTWLITSISAFFRLFMNLWYCTPFFYNSTHRKRGQCIQKTREVMSDIDGCIRHRNALCFIWLFDLCPLLDVWKPGNEKQRICDEDPESDQQLRLVWCIYSLNTWWLSVRRVRDHVWTHSDSPWSFPDSPQKSADSSTQTETRFSTWSWPCTQYCSCL